MVREEIQALVEKVVVHVVMHPSLEILVAAFVVAVVVVVVIAAVVKWKVEERGFAVFVVAVVAGSAVVGGVFVVVSWVCVAIVVVQKEGIQDACEGIVDLIVYLAFVVETLDCLV